MTPTMRWLLVWAGLVLLLLTPWSVAAQTLQMNYSVDWFFVGATQPFQQGGVVADESSCDPTGSLPTAPNNVVNPGTLWWDHDPDGTGPAPVWVCNLDITTIVSPFVRGSYFARMRAIDPVAPAGADTSVESPNSNPFDVAGVPPAPGAVVIRQ
jgi:hypothetical protein